MFAIDVQSTTYLCLYIYIYIYIIYIYMYIYIYIGLVNAPNFMYSIKIAHELLSQTKFVVL